MAEKLTDFFASLEAFLPPLFHGFLKFVFLRAEITVTVGGGNSIDYTINLTSTLHLGLVPVWG